MDGKTQYANTTGPCTTTMTTAAGAVETIVTEGANANLTTMMNLKEPSLWRLAMPTLGMSAAAKQAAKMIAAKAAKMIAVTMGSVETDTADKAQTPP